MDKAKILFLDIDGVLNISRYGEDVYSEGDKQHKDLVKPCVPIVTSCYEALKSIADNVPELKVIWSTDWRMHDDEEWYGWKNPLKWLEANCSFLNGKIVGKTPKKMSSDRPEEIAMWLSDNEREKTYDILGYAILDDYAPHAMYWFGKHFFRTWFDTGLTSNLAKSVIECLNTFGYDKPAFMH